MSTPRRTHENTSGAILPPTTKIHQHQHRYTFSTRREESFREVSPSHEANKVKNENKKKINIFYIYKKKSRVKKRIKVMNRKGRGTKGEKSTQLGMMRDGKRSNDGKTSSLEHTQTHTHTHTNQEPRAVVAGPQTEMIGGWESSRAPPA